MNIEHEIQIDEPRFDKMKKKAQQNKYNLLAYPTFIVLGLTLMCLEDSKFMSIFWEFPWVTVGVSFYVLVMLVYVWIKGNELNEMGQKLTNDFDSICPYISLFSKYELHLKVAYFAFLWGMIWFIRNNPEIIDLIEKVAIMLIILFINQKIKDPMEWKKIDTVKII